MKKARRGKNEGAIFQRANGLWTARIELPRSATGDRRRKEITAKTKERLLEKLAEPRRQFYINGDLPSTSQTTAQWLTYWLENIIRKEVRPNTFNGYRAVVNNQIIPAIGRVRLDNLKPAHIRRVHDHVTAKRTSSYAANAHRVLAKSLADAEREGLIHRNPAKLISAPRKTRKELQALDVPEAVELYWSAVRALQITGGTYDPHPVLYATLLLTGARRGEILGLEWDRISDVIDLSWQMQYIQDISRAPRDYEYRHINDGLYWTRPKSSAGWRVIPIIPQLANLLALHRESVPDNQYGLVFTSEQGRPLRPDTETKRWPVWLTASGITPKRVRLHDLRHTTVDLLYEAGVPEDVIMEIVGHSTRTVTRGYKARGNQTRLTAAMLQLSTLLNGGVTDNSTLPPVGEVP